jgi:hypothetical protein
MSGGTHRRPRKKILTERLKFQLSNTMGYTLMGSLIGFLLGVALAYSMGDKWTSVPHPLPGLPDDTSADTDLTPPPDWVPSSPETPMPSCENGCVARPRSMQRPLMAPMVYRVPIRTPKSLVTHTTRPGARGSSTSSPLMAPTSSVSPAPVILAPSPTPSRSNPTSSHTHGRSCSRNENHHGWSHWKLSDPHQSGPVWKASVRGLSAGGRDRSHCPDGHVPGMCGRDQAP